MRKDRTIFYLMVHSAIARRQELFIRVSCVRQEPKYLCYHLLPPSCLSAKLDWKMQRASPAALHTESGGFPEGDLATACGFTAGTAGEARGRQGPGGLWWALHARPLS